METPGAWRPISLVSTTGKVIESAMRDRVANAAETFRLLPEGQMGNRKDRSTEHTILLIVEAVKEAWARGGTAALIQLDFAAAFDKIIHHRLIDIIDNKGFPT